MIDVVTPATHRRIIQLAQHVEKQWREFRSAADGSEPHEESMAAGKMIGRAEGILMQRDSIGPEDAVALLERLSDESNTPVIETARKLILPHRALRGDGASLLRNGEHTRRIREASRC